MTAHTPIRPAAEVRAAMSEPLRRLWAAVLFENIRNAVGIMDSSTQRRDDFDFIQAEARRWLRSPDFEMVCTFAGFEPDAIRDAILTGRVTAEEMRQRARHAKGAYACHHHGKLEAAA